jgi:hypothetical protein
MKNVGARQKRKFASSREPNQADGAAHFSKFEEVNFSDQFQSHGNQVQLVCLHLLTGPRRFMAGREILEGSGCDSKGRFLGGASVSRSKQLVSLYIFGFRIRRLIFPMKLIWGIGGLMGWETLLSLSEQ